MIERTYQDRTCQNIKLKVYDGFTDFEKSEDVVIQYGDGQGNDVDIKTADLDFKGAMAKAHFAGDDSYKEEHLFWQAYPEQKEIHCIILNNKDITIYNDILSSVHHEYGHITNADEFQNSTAPYDTPEGYKQEETKAQRFEKFGMDSYEMSFLFVIMLKERGLTVIYTGCRGIQEPMVM